MTDNGRSKQFAVKIPGDIIESLERQPDVADVLSMYLEGRFEELAEIPVSVDRYGKIISRLGQLMWDLWPYHVLQGADEKAILDFSPIAGAAELLLELQVLFYVWLRIRGSATPKKRIKTSTLSGRLDALRFPLNYLQAHNLRSMALLCDSENWAAFKTFLTDQKLSFGTIFQVVSALRAIQCVRAHLPFPFRLPHFHDEELSRELAAEDRKKPIQTFSIPSRLMDLLYGTALTIVEAAWPHRDRVAEILQQLQHNGSDAGEKDDPQTEKYKAELRHYMGKTLPATALTACYICTDGFTGMRPAETYQLQPGCYATREVGKTIFHVLVGATSKEVDGLKTDEWLCSPGAGKAVELAEALTRGSREKMLAAAKIYDQSGERGMAERQRRAANCLWLEYSYGNKLPKASQVAMGMRVHAFARQVGATVTEQDLDEFRLVNRNVPASRVPSVGQVWPFHRRQMRRMFAVFARRHNLAGIPAIKQQFKHLRARITDYYGSGSWQARAADVRADKELMSLIDRSYLDDQANTLQRLFNGHDKLCGGGGRAIIQQRQSEPLTYSSWDKVRKLVEQGKLTYHSTGFAGCINGYRCEMDGVVNPSFCVECDGAVITIEHARDWRAEHINLVRYLRQHPGISESELSYYLTKIRAAERVMTDLGIDFQRYQKEGLPHDG